MKFTGWNKCMGDNINGWAKLSLRKLLDSSFVSSPTMGSQCDQAKMCWGFNGRPHCLLINIRSVTEYCSVSFNSSLTTE